MGWVVRGLLELSAVGFLAWGTLALHFAGPGRGGLADLLAVAWAVVGLAILLLVRPFGRRLTMFAAAVAVLLVWWSTIRPSNDRTWLADVARTPHGELSGERLTIHDLRNFDYRSETDFTERWETRTYDLSGLDRLDFFLSYWGSPKIAHTIVSWAFQDGQHLAVSDRDAQGGGRVLRRARRLLPAVRALLRGGRRARPDPASNQLPR